MNIGMQGAQELCFKIDNHDRETGCVLAFMKWEDQSHISVRHSRVINSTYG